MNKSLSTCETPAGRHTRYPLRPAMRNGLLALVVVLQCGLLQANAADDVAAAGATQAEIPWMSGGVGEEAREEMRMAASAYNVHVVFSARNGDYLADIPVTVTTRNGRKIYSGVSEGPLLYLKLSPGSYRIAARIDGAWQDKRIESGASGRTTKVTFVSRGE